MILSSAKTLTVAADCAAAGIPRSLWIRTSAGPQTGFGHLRRCLTLAQSLQECCRPLFLVDCDDFSSMELLEDTGWDFCCRKLSEVWSGLPEPAGILIDTRTTEGLDELIATARCRSIPVISIHDLGLNPLSSDVVIDGSIVPMAPEAVYRPAAYYHGADFMILDPVYNHLHQKGRKGREHIRSVFVSLGGGNSERLFRMVLQGLKQWSEEAEVIGVPGFVSWGQNDLSGSEVAPRNFRWEGRNVEQSLYRADLAITAGGISAYEALCAGTPLLALSHDPLQQITISELARRNACIDLGPGNELTPREIVEAVARVDSDLELRKRLSIQGRRIVDGRGCERVCELVRRSIRSAAACRRAS
jgi:UDP-2,4-diacetamido-2,4,6-trideoxy-beta-L-altropyranose hydrolase